MKEPHMVYLVKAKVKGEEEFRSYFYSIFDRYYKA